MGHDAPDDHLTCQSGQRPWNYLRKESRRSINESDCPGHLPATGRRPFKLRVMPDLLGGRVGVGLALYASKRTLYLTEVGVDGNEVFGQERIQRVELPVELRIEHINAIGKPHVERYDRPEDHNDRPDDRPDNSDDLLCRHASRLHRNGASVKNVSTSNQDKPRLSEWLRFPPPWLRIFLLPDGALNTAIR